MIEKYDIAKNIFDNYISKIKLSYEFIDSVDASYKSKTPSETLSTGTGFCTEQVELSEYLLQKHNIAPIEKYEIFAMPSNNIPEPKIDLSHGFIGIPNDKNWILFETGFRVRNRGGVKIFPTEMDGVKYVLKLYNQSLIVAGITDMDLHLYKYQFPAQNLSFNDFAKRILAENKRINIK